MKKVAVILLGIIISTLVVNANNNLPKSQALFIYNFLKYIEWPNDDVKKEFIIGVIGDAQVTKALRDLTYNRKIAGKGIRIVNTTSPTELGNCQIIFIPKERNSCLSGLSRRIKGSSCLTVFENTGQENSCASIDLINSKGKLTYRINHEIAREQDVVISNILVNMAAL